MLINQLSEESFQESVNAIDSTRSAAAMVSNEELFRDALGDASSLTYSESCWLNLK